MPGTTETDFFERADGDRQRPANRGPRRATSQDGRAWIGHEANPERAVTELVDADPRDVADEPDAPWPNSRCTCQGRHNRHKGLDVVTASSGRLWQASGFRMRIDSS